MANSIQTFQEIPNAPKAVGPYSPAVRAGGMIFISGQVPIDPSTGQIVGTDISVQTQQVLANLKAVLSHVGLGFESVVKSTIFLTDLSNFQIVNTLYSEALGGHKPARSTIQVSALPLGANVEIEMIAVDTAK